MDCNQLRPFMENLKYLNLRACIIIGDINRLFESCLQLENIHFCRISQEIVDIFIAHTFPKLEVFAYEYELLQYNRFREFLSLNPQLKHLDIDIISVTKAGSPNQYELN